jgi:hypothetical protein
VTMALDLHQLAPAPSPQSVEFFLRETFCTASPKNPKVTLNDVLTETRRSKVLSEFLPLKALPDSPRRVPLLTAVQIARNAKLEESALPSWIGVNGELKLSLGELAVWLFRDAQAISLTEKPVNA